MHVSEHDNKFIQINQLKSSKNKISEEYYKKIVNKIMIKYENYPRIRQFYEFTICYTINY